MGIKDLAWLIAPVGPDIFLREYWDRAPLVLSRGNAAYHAGIFSRSDADQLVGLHRFRRGEFCVLPDNPSVDPIAVELSEEGLADSSEVYRKYQQGSSLFFYGIHRYWHSIGQLARNLSHDIRMPV